MTHYPTSKEIKLWTASAIDVFQSIMPQINMPYPCVHIATENTFVEMRSRLVEQTGCTHIEANMDEAAIMEYIHGDIGYAILIRQSLLPDRDEYHFCSMLWHELGHFYAINSESTNFYHYSDPCVIDKSRNIEVTEDGPVLGMSDERLRQEGYWFWQEFIAESISKYVSYKYRSSGSDYHPELIDWEPNTWVDVENKLIEHLKDVLGYHQYTIDEYSLAHYFANLLMDDFIKLYVQAATDGKLKVYDEDIGAVVYPEELIEPTCISDIKSTEMQKPFWKMKQILEEQLAKEQFWLIDEQFLLDVGSCIGEMMLRKFIEKTRRF